MSPKLPTFDEVCGLIQGEETRCQVMSVSPSLDKPISESSTHKVMMNNQRGEFVAKLAKGKNKRPVQFHCDHCDRDGHSKDKCWLLHLHLCANKDKVQEAKLAILGNSIEFQSKLESLAQQFQQLL